MLFVGVLRLPPSPFPTNDDDGAMMLMLLLSALGALVSGWKLTLGEYVEDCDRWEEEYDEELLLR